MPEKIRIDEFTEEQIARLRRRYEAGEETILAIASDFGTSYRTVNALARRHDWIRAGARRAASRAKAPRKSAAKTKAVRNAEAAPPPAPADPQAPSLAPRIRAALEAEIETLQARSTGESAATLASLARSLANLRSYEAAGAKGKAGTQDDGPPLDLAELRRELSRRLAVLREGPEGD